MGGPPHLFPFRFTLIQLGKPSSGRALLLQGFAIHSSSIGSAHCGCLCVKLEKLGTKWTGRAYRLEHGFWFVPARFRTGTVGGWTNGWSRWLQARRREPGTTTALSLAWMRLVQSLPRSRSSACSSLALASRVAPATSAFLGRDIDGKKWATSLDCFNHFCSSFTRQRVRQQAGMSCHTQHQQWLPRTSASRRDKSRAKEGLTMFPSAPA